MTNEDNAITKQDRMSAFVWVGMAVIRLEFKILDWKIITTILLHIKSYVIILI